MKRVTCSPDRRQERTKRSKTHSHVESCQPKISCDYCHKDITNTARILCAVCVEFDLCVECFSAGVELRGHKYWHNYRLVEDLRFSFLTPDWTANEEQLLLEGLELFGIGNWYDVANYVSSKDFDECKEHYEQFYLNSPDWPDVSFDGVCDSRLDGARHCKKSKCSKSRKQRRATNQRTSTKKKIVHDPLPSTVISLSGYMPKRREFEIEWDNNCEQRVMDIEFTESDTEQEFELKMRLLEMYNERLDKRHNVRQLVVEKKLHDQPYQTQLKKSRTPGEEKIHTEMKRFLQLMNVSEYEELIEGMARQQELEKRIKELQEYRSAGLTSMQDVPEYKKLLSQKEKGKLKKSSLRSSSIPSSPPSSVAAPSVPTVSPPASPSYEIRLRSSLEVPRSSTPPYPAYEERQPITRVRTVNRRQEEQRRQQRQILAPVVVVDQFQQRRANEPKHLKKDISHNVESFSLKDTALTTGTSVFLQSTEGHNVFAVAVI